MGVNLLNERGFVVYNRKSPNPYWEELRSTKEKQVKNLYASLPTNRTNIYENLGNSLIRMGEIEQQKELALIKSIFGTDVDGNSIDITQETELQLINHLNEIMVGKESYLQAQKQLKLAQQQYEQGKKNLAPSISSLFLPKLQQYLGQGINNFIKTRKDTKTVEDIVRDWDKQWERVLDTAIDRAMKELLTHQTDIEDIFGTYVDNPNLYNVYVNEARESFHKVLKQKIGTDNIHSLMRNQMTSIQQKITQIL